MRGYPQFNYPAFFEAAYRLRATGLQVENPAENCGPTPGMAIASAEREQGKKTFKDYMQADLQMLARVDAVVVLPGWRQSQGANLEVHIARELGMPVMRYDDGELKPLLDIVGLSGYAQSGKDTAARFLIDERGYQRLAFADALREALYVLNPFIADADRHLVDLVDDVGWDVAKTGYAEVRELLQRMGTEVGRNLIGENTWVDAVMNKTEDGGRYVITDVRFPNEASAIKRMGGRLWRIERPGVGPANNHASEHALADYPFDVVIDNAGPLESLRDSVLFNHDYVLAA